MGERMSLKSMGGRVYRCARGNCGAPLAGPEDQDEHNLATHLGRHSGGQPVPAEHDPLTDKLTGILGHI